MFGVCSVGASPSLSFALLVTTAGLRPQWTQTKAGSPVNYQLVSPSSFKSHLGSEFIDSIDFFFLNKLPDVTVWYLKKTRTISALYLNTGIIDATGVFKLLIKYK